jgi:hypothetical protein
MSDTHWIKLNAAHRNPVRNKEKQFELRKSDRDYKPFDHLKLCIWDNDDFTGEVISATVNSVYLGLDGLQKGYCLMSIDVWGVECCTPEYIRTMRMY